MFLSWLHIGNFWVRSWPYIFHILAVSWQYLCNVMVISGQYFDNILAISGQYLGNLLAISRQYLSSVLATYLQYIGNILAIKLRIRYQEMIRHYICIYEFKSILSEPFFSWTELVSTLFEMQIHSQGKWYRYFLFNIRESDPFLIKTKMKLD